MHTGNLGVVVGEHKIEYPTVLVKVGDFSDTADTVEGRRLFDDLRVTRIHMYPQKMQREVLPAVESVASRVVHIAVGLAAQHF